jgi:hypothetical protein
MSHEREPRVRVVFSPRGVERVEVWGRDHADQEQAMRLFFKLSGAFDHLHELCRSCGSNR